MKTYLLTLSYDGTDYSGWQRQKNAVTVQQATEDALCKLLGAPVSITASGRTDEGVHALGQTVSFDCETSVPTEKFAEALNCKLPQSIRAISCTLAADGFCARRSAKKKTYVYRFYLSDNIIPHADRYALRVSAPLNGELLGRAAKLIEGTHDFKEFYCLGSSAKTTVRTVYNCEFVSFPAQGLMPQSYEFRICGNGFLYKMVRLLAGALIMLNDGKITFEDFKHAIAGESGKVKKVPAPSKGLTLLSVEYE